MDEGKFRQRVDDHYRVMANAKKNLRTSGRLQLGAALGLLSVAAVNAMQPEESATVTAAVGGVLALASAGIARVALAAGGSVQVEKQATTYLSRVRVLGLLLLLSGGATGASSTFIAEPAQMSIVAAWVGLWLVDLGACALGYMAATTLLRAFEQQRKKATQKVQ